MFRTTITRRVLTPRYTPAATRTTFLARPFSQQTQLQAAKQSQNKDDLKPESNEYSKSGSDSKAAQGSTAFDPSTTTPEAQEASAEQESGGKKNSLNVSPANPEVSKPRDPTEGGHEGSAAESGQGNSDRARTSGGGSPAKGSEGKKYSS